jgi:hypothetical protein
MKDIFRKFYLSYICVVLNTCGFAHSPELSDSDTVITEPSWELLREWHLIQRRLCGTCMVDGRNRTSFKCPKGVHSNLWWLHAVLRESPNQPLQSLRCHSICHVCTSMSAQYNMHKLSEFLFCMVETTLL